MKSPNVWVAVLNQTEMKLFERDLEDHGLSHVKTFVNENAGVKDEDLTRHHEGVVAEGSQRHVLDAGLSPHDLAVETFARKMAGFLDKEYRSEHVYRLWIVAEPRMLGRLRKHMDPKTEHAVVRWVHKDLIGADTATIEHALGDS